MRTGSPLSLSILAAGLLILSGFAAKAEASIGRIAKVNGEVLILSGETLTRITAPGALLNDGDRVQTKQGEVEVRFNDGAIIRISPFSNAMLQEREEQSGFWILKTSAAARRITCLVGKLFFQSGAPGKNNYLQTPTAVAGIRGSSGDIGFDNLNSYLNMYTGEAAVMGSIIRGFFQNPGAAAADRNVVYQALARAAEVKQRADAAGRTVDTAQAQLTIVEVGRQVAQALQKNPDAAVQLDGKLIDQQTSAAIAVAAAKVAVEQIKEEKASAEKAAAEARRTGDTQKAQQADGAAQRAEQDRVAADQQAAAAKAAAEQANAAAQRRDLESAAKAAQTADKAATEAIRIEQETRRTLQQVVTTAPTTTPTTGATTTAAPTTAGTTEATTTATTAPTTVMTTIPTTAPSTTTSTTTVSSSTSSSSTTITTPSR